MWRSKKVIICAVLAGVLLFGSLGGIVLANEGEDDNGPAAKFGEFINKVCAIYEDNTDDEIEYPEALKAAIDEAHSQMRAEYPRGRLPHEPMACLESLVDDPEDVKAAFDQARTELEDGTLEGGRGALMARVLEILGIDEEEWQAACPEMRAPAMEKHPQGLTDEQKEALQEWLDSRPGLTDEQKEALQEWWDSRAEDLPMKFGGRMHGGFPGMGGPCAPTATE